MNTPAHNISTLVDITLAKPGQRLQLSPRKAARVVEMLRRMGCRPIAHGNGEMWQMMVGPHELRIVVLAGVANVMVFEGVEGVEVAAAPAQQTAQRVGREVTPTLLAKLARQRGRQPLRKRG